jgi:hypothetical protein
VHDRPTRSNSHEEESVLGVPAWCAQFREINRGLVERREGEESRTQTGFQARRRGSVGVGAVN